MAYVKTDWVNDVTAANAANLNKIEQGIYDAHQAIETLALVNLFYPVGAKFETLDEDFDPNTAYPGTTWIKDTGGTFVISAGGDYEVSENMKDGGEETVTLTAAQSGMPAHAHGPYAENYGYVMARNTVRLGDMGAQAGTGRHYAYQDTNADGYWARPAATGTATAQNATEAHNNMPPYKVAHRWWRTA